MKKLKWILILIVAFIACEMIHRNFKSYWKPDVVIYIEFDSDIEIRPFTNFTYILTKDFNVQINSEKIVIPEGFETDLASIPRAFWAIMPPQYSAYVIPGIIHDYFYRCANLYDRQFADDVLYYALLQNGITEETASLFYFAVRIFGSHDFVKSLPCSNDD